MLELWDIYDINRNRTGVKVARCMASELPQGSPYRPVVAPTGKLTLQPGEYHLSVHVWFINSKGELLIQKRAETKEHMPGVWAACGGAVLAGEDTLHAAVRESYEEMGLVLDMRRLLRIVTYTNPDRHSHMDVYLYQIEVDPSELTLQTEEVSRAGWFTLDEFVGKKFTDEHFRRYNYMDILYAFFSFSAEWQRRGLTIRGTRREADELLDIYDITGARTGMTMRRGSAQRYGDYYMAVHIWFIGADGRVLLQRRSMHCAYKPGCFAATGGIARAGEDAWTAAEREVYEELGLRLDRASSFRLCRYVDCGYICAVYVSTQDIREDELRLQKDEVSTVQFVSADMLERYSGSESFLRPPYMPLVISAIRAIEAEHRRGGM